MACPVQQGDNLRLRVGGSVQVRILLTLAHGSRTLRHLSYDKLLRKRRS